MNQLRAIIGFTAMLLFGVSAIVWFTMVLIPALTGSSATANLGSLIFWTVVTLVVWRAAAGRGWGFAAPPASRPEPRRRETQDGPQGDDR